MDSLVKFVGFCLAIVSLIACSHTNKLPEQNKTEFYAKLPYTWIAQMNFAAEDFKKTYAYKNYQNSEYGPNCFKVETYNEGNKFYVDILPENNVKEEGDFLVIDPKGASYCGRGISYEFDEAGQFLRKIHQR